MCGLQYVEPTVDRFCLRWNNCKCSHGFALGSVTPKQNYFDQYFLSEDHHRLLEDRTTTFINKTDSSDPTRTEIYWICELKTFAPLGLNICDIV